MDEIINEPLVKALATRHAVVFVGAGASIPSGLTDWRQFLEGLLRYAISLSSERQWWRTRKFLDDGDYLLAAEMLQRGLPAPTFNHYIQDTFGAAVKPNDIHRSIARLPFSLALTTNFDVLLENAYHVRYHQVTWIGQQ